MPLKINIINCPSCAAAIPIEEGKTQITCSYCGSKFTISNENEFVYRHVDEARVRQAEIDRMIRLKELEMEEKKRQIGNYKSIAAISGLLLLILIMGIGYLFDADGLITFGLAGIVIYCLGGMLIFIEKSSLKEKQIEHELSQNSKLNKDAGPQMIPILRTKVFNQELVPDHHFCGHCGAKLMADAKFCHKCGHIVAKLPSPPKAGKQRRKVH